MGYRTIEPAYLQSQEDFVKTLRTQSDIELNDVDYVQISMPRFRVMLASCLRFKPERTTRTLDVGRSQLSYLLSQHYYSVSTIGLPLGSHGYAHERSVGELAGGPQEHIVMNLNDTQDRSIDCGTVFDLVVFAEVLEHLYTAPEIVMHAFREIMSESGILILQTPNAVCLKHRLQFLTGQNPFERIRINRDNPGHYREYTKGELVDSADVAGFELLEHSYVNYYPKRRGFCSLTKSDVFRLLCRICPSFCYGQIAVFRRR